ncbi:hypothetical protein CEXT_218071 [Caerostris extrusa]|uniref:Uncharacterized protein n=1 Tax=Caerostris extrusa TaxID=172846 RepID=A0AAV4MFF5_CAEEX|nr:hypothetical protein CEXT_218071 [Caerostris extrusa]
MSLSAGVGPQRISKVLSFIREIRKPLAICKDDWSPNEFPFLHFAFTNGLKNDRATYRDGTDSSSFLQKSRFRLYPYKC